MTVANCSDQLLVERRCTGPELELERQIIEDKA